MAQSCPSKLNIVFVAGNKNAERFRQDPAFLYRCENPALALRELGHQVTLCHYTDLPQYRQSAQLVIFHRPCFRNWRSRWLIQRTLKSMRKRGARLIADFDDLVFDPHYAELSPGVINGYVSLVQTQKNFRQHQQTLTLFDALSVSTHPLVEHLSANTDSKILWLPNSPFFAWQQYAIKPTPKDTLLLKYLPGTRSHDKDFATIAEPLTQFLAETPTATLKITGVLDADRLPQALQKLSSQLQFEPKQPFKYYPSVVNDGHLHLAPLQDTLFNQCKSALKAIEAGYFNRPVLATPIPDILRYQASGARFASNDEQWYQQLQAFAKHPFSDVSMRAAVSAQSSAHDHAQALVNWYVNNA